MSSFICIAEFTSKDGKDQELHNELFRLIAPTKAEEGCLNYQFTQDVLNPNRYIMIEIFRSKEDFLVHTNTSHVSAFKEKVKSLTESVNLTLGNEAPLTSLAA